MPPQLSYSQDAIIAQPGMPFDGDIFEQTRISRICGVAIPFGVLCEFDANNNAQPLQTATTLSGTVTLTAASAAITFSGNQTLPQGQALIFSDQPGVVYYLAAAIAAGTAGTLTVAYSGAGGAGKTTSIAFKPNLVGISIGGPLTEEESYVPWAVPTKLAGTVTTTLNSTALTFSVAQTLAAGTQIVFSGQPGVIYFIATATSASTSATLTSNYIGTAGAGQTATTSPAAGTCAGYLQGRVGSFLRVGHIWVQGDNGGTAALGPINVRHSSTGANPQGVFTYTGFTQTAGNEIDVAPGCLMYPPVGQGSTLTTQYTDNFGNVFSIYPVEINI